MSVSLRQAAIYWRSLIGATRAPVEGEEGLPGIVHCVW